MTPGDPIPLDALRAEFEQWLRDQGIDPDTIDFKVSHATRIETIDGVVREIRTTVLELPDGQRFEWIPEQ